MEMAPTVNMLKYLACGKGKKTANLWFKRILIAAPGYIHRHSYLHSNFEPKFGHEKEVLGTQKSLVAAGNGQAFDARYLLDF